MPRITGDADDVKIAAAKPIRTGNRDEIILVVEDDPLMCKLACDALDELGYTVLQAGNAADALAILDQEPNIKLLFTDVVMPDVNGKKLAEEALRRRPSLKVLCSPRDTRPMPSFTVACSTRAFNSSVSRSLSTSLPRRCVQ